MISIDLLEVLLRSVPQYLLFGALALFIFGWIEKKSKYIIIGEALMGILGISGFVVLQSGMIPSPMQPGINQEHTEMVIKMLFLASLNGFLALVSLLIRGIWKRSIKPLVFATFAVSLFLFFSSTKLSKIKFELNVPVEEVVE